MIIPRFKLSQCERNITINIRAPYCNLKDLEVTVYENVFIFHTSPYYLRLNLPGEMLEDDFTKSSFDTNTGEFTYTIQKANHGEYFPDLDLITKLLTPKIIVSGQENKIIIFPIQEDKERQVEDLNEEFGFALAGKNNFHHISAEFQDVFEIDPREVKLTERHKMRLQYEQGKFNMDHYLCDYIENEDIIKIMDLKSAWSDLKNDEIQFSDIELDFLKDLPNIQYNLSDVQIKYSHSSLIDILFAYCYDRRTTYYEGSSESGWNIIKLAASFCWLDVFENPKEALVSAFRRSVIYPLYRNFDLSQTIFTDLKQLLKLDDKYIIKCLIDIYNIFLNGDSCRYIINNLFIKDYIIYVMKWNRSQWQEIVCAVENTIIKKNDLGLNLEEIENDICCKLGKLSILNITDDESDDTEYDSDSSSDDSDGSSTDISNN